MKTSLLRSIILLLIPCLLAGALRPLFAQQTDASPAQPAAALDLKPPKTPGPERARNLDYRLAPLDQIIVDVVGEAQLSKELRVSAGGTVTFPYLRKVEVVNRTAAQVENQLQTLLSAGYLVDPQVIVTVKEYRKRFVTVIGEVNKQGPVEFSGEQPLNMVEAIGLAGGPTQLAKDRVQVTKQNGRVLEFSLSELRRSASREQIPQLDHGDIIWIPQSTF